MTIVTPDNHGPLVNVAMWMVLGPMILVSGIKVYTKWESVRKLQGDDFLMLFSMILAISQSVATTEQVRSGLGRNQYSLTENQIDSFYLCQYVAQILYVVTIFIVKLIALQFYTLLSEPRHQKFIIKTSMLFIILWITIAIFVISFQCHPPHTWLMSSGGCINKSAFWTINTIVDIATQILIGLLPMFLLRNLHTKSWTKFFSMLAFTPNLLTIPLSIIRLVYYFKGQSSDNYTWSSTTLAMITALHAMLSVLIAGIPFSKPIVDSLTLPIVIEDDAGGYAVGNIYGSAVRGATPTKFSWLQSHKSSIIDSLTMWSRPRTRGTGTMSNRSTEIGGTNVSTEIGDSQELNQV